MEIYCYVEIIVFPTTLTTSVQPSHNFSPSYPISNDIASIQTVILYLHMI